MSKFSNTIYRHRKTFCFLTAALVVLAVAAVFLLPRAGKNPEPEEPPAIPFDDIKVYDRLQAYSPRENKNAYGIGSLYTRCDDSVTALQSFSNWPEGITAHKVTDETVQDAWEVQRFDTSAYLEEHPEFAECSLAAVASKAEQAGGEENGEFDISQITTSSYSFTLEEGCYVLVNRDDLRLLTRFEDLPSVGFRMVSTLETFGVGEESGFEGSIHLSQYWQKEHQFASLDTLEDNSIYEITSVIVTDDWDSDVDIVYMATTGDLLQGTTEAGYEKLAWRGMAEIYHVDSGSSANAGEPLVPGDIVDF